MKSMPGRHLLQKTVRGDPGEDRLTGQGRSGISYINKRERVRAEPLDRRERSGRLGAI